MDTLENLKKYGTEISMRESDTFFDDKNIQLKLENYKFGKAYDFIALEVHYKY